MIANWKEYKLSDLIKIYNGKNYSHLVQGQIPVYGSGGIMCYVNDFLYEGEAILLPRKGTLNNILYTKGKIWTVDTMYYAIVNENATPYFLYCYLNLLKLNQLDSGSALPSMTQSIYYSVEVRIPVIEYQQRVASILSTYDDLIEINSKRIEILEQSARELYKEWFVRMRFPGYQKTKFKKGIPEGWEVKSLREMVASNETNLYDNFPYTIVKYLDTGSLVKGKISNYLEMNLSDIPSRAKRLVKHNNILFSSVRPNQLHYGILKCPPSNLIVSTGFIVLDSFWDIADFLYYSITQEEIVEYLQNIAEGAVSAYPSIKPEDLLSIKFIVPPKEKLLALDLYFKNINEQITNLQQQNQQLSKIRNRLLPRLISGKLEVKAE